MNKTENRLWKFRKYRDGHRCLVSHACGHPYRITLNNVKDRSDVFEWIDHMMEKSWMDEELTLSLVRGFVKVGLLPRGTEAVYTPDAFEARRRDGEVINFFTDPDSFKEMFEHGAHLEKNPRLVLVFPTGESERFP